MTRLIAPALLAVLLSGCGGDGAKKAEGAGTAQGEVLPGSVSDAMIPVDQIKSQAPLAPKVEGADKSDSKVSDKAKDEPANKPAAEAEPVAEAAEPSAQE
jgi:hypothetical protein